MDLPKILLAIEPTSGGAYKHLLQLAMHMPSQGFDVSVILSPVRNPLCLKDAEVLEKLGVKCYFIPMRRAISPFSDLKALRAFYQHLKRTGYQVAHFHSSKAGFVGRLAAFLARTPKTIYTPHCYYFEARKGPSRFFYKKLEQLAARFTDHIVSISESEAALTLSENITGPAHSLVIKNAINTEQPVHHYNPGAIRQKYGIAPGAKVIAGVGRLCRQKDWLTFLKVAGEVLERRNDVVFLLAGEGEYMQEISSEVEARGLSGKVLMPGHVKNTGEIYAISDMVLNTSLWEGISYVLLEAMAFKLPVIATNIPGNRDVVSHLKNGCLFPKKDHRRGAEAVELLLSFENVRTEMGEAGYQFLQENHGLDEFIRKHRDLYLLQPEHVALERAHPNL